MTIAHGANAIIYFRWRQCRWGKEQFNDGLLPHSGEKSRFMVNQPASVASYSILVTKFLNPPAGFCSYHL